MLQPRRRSLRLTAIIYVLCPTAVQPALYSCVLILFLLPWLQLVLRHAPTYIFHVYVSSIYLVLCPSHVHQVCIWFSTCTVLGSNFILVHQPWYSVCPCLLEVMRRINSVAEWSTMDISNNVLRQKRLCPEVPHSLLRSCDGGVGSTPLTIRCNRGHLYEYNVWFNCAGCRVSLCFFRKAVVVKVALSSLGSPVAMKTRVIIGHRVSQSVEMKDAWVYNSPA